MKMADLQGRILGRQKQTLLPAGAQTAGSVHPHLTGQPEAEALATATLRGTGSRLVALLTDTVKTE